MWRLFTFLLQSTASNRESWTHRQDCSAFCCSPTWLSFHTTRNYRLLLHIIKGTPKSLALLHVLSLALPSDHHEHARHHYHHQRTLQVARACRTDGLGVMSGWNCRSIGPTCTSEKHDTLAATNLVRHKSNCPSSWNVLCYAACACHITCANCRHRYTRTSH